MAKALDCEVLKHLAEMLKPEYFQILLHLAINLDDEGRGVFKTNEISKKLEIPQQRVSEYINKLSKNSLIFTGKKLVVICCVVI